MTDHLDRLKAALADRYALERELGVGGMATVYLAEDLKHHRKVAVKVLRPELAAVLGGERFVQEITTTANLQHPHILPLFDSGEADGFLYYVMPFIDGETLRDKLNRETQLGIEEAVKITTEVADALDYAHRHNVIHRDIKPENILLHDGRPTVADFGIALAVSAAAGGRMTETGLSLGTPHYMSPEQATAEKDITNRSDIYSLSAVLYEMLTGEPPHMGNSAQQIIMKIVTEDVQPVTELRKTVPPNVAAATAKALEKLPADRFANAAEFAEALTNPAFALPAAAGVAAITIQRAGPWKRIAIGLAALVALLAVITIWALLRSPAEAPKNVSRVTIPMPDGEEVVVTNGPDIAISRDGTRMVYFGPSELDRRLWLRSLDSLHARPLRQTEDARSPVFSPDGEYVAFWQDRSVKVVSTSGSAPEEIVGSESPYCLDWSTDGMLYFGSAGGGISRVSLTGDEPEVLTVPDTSGGELRHTGVYVLPNGAGALFVRWRGRWDNADIAVLDFGTGEVRPLITGFHPKYAESGHLVYVQSDSVLMAAPFDPDRMVVTGPSVALLDGVSTQWDGTAEYTLTRTGSLLYSTASVVQPKPVWVGRNGIEREIDPDWTSRGSYTALSPDDSRLINSNGINIWIKVLDQGPSHQLTFEGNRNVGSVWTPDGQFVTFVSDRAGQWDLWQKRADGSGPVILLHELGVSALPSAWSPDGRWLVFISPWGGSSDIYAIQPEIDSTTIPLVVTEFSERSPTLSPDGRWFAYSSDQSGRFEVYVRPFPNSGDGVWLVSETGGMDPTWAQNGQELFYVNGNQEMVVVDVETSPTFRRLSERVLFSTAEYLSGGIQHNYAVSHDDQRFVMRKQVGAPNIEVMLVLNFFEELKQQVGNGND